jgi:flagellar FliL protein
MSKLKIIIPVVLVVLGGAYKFVLAKPAAEAKPKVDGTVYVLGKDFLVNLADGRFAKVTAALVLSPKDTSTAAKAGEGAPTPPDGFGNMTQEALVRADITDVLTDAHDSDLISRTGRDKLRKKILVRLNKDTDVKATDVVFTDVTVQ